MLPDIVSKLVTQLRLDVGSLGAVAVLVGKAVGSNQKDAAQYPQNNGPHLCCQLSLLIYCAWLSFAYYRALNCSNTLPERNDAAVTVPLVSVMVSSFCIIIACAINKFIRILKIKMVMTASQK